MRLVSFADPRAPRLGALAPDGETICDLEAAASARAVAAPRPDAPPVTMAACALISINLFLALK